MEHESHDEEDEIVDDDNSKSLAVERFGFLQEDRQVIQDLIAGVRRVLKRKSITPQQICGLGKLLHGLERLPRPTPGIGITVTIGSRTPQHCFYRSLDLSESSFELSSGGAEYTPDVGSDSYTSFSFEVEVGGFRSDAMITDLEDWVYGFVQSLCDEDQDFDVENNDESCVPDKDQNTPDDDWDQLDTGY